MPERRQAHRREPIIVEVRGRDWEAVPLPWLQRNDLGNEILRQYTEVLNEAFKAYTDPTTQAAQVEIKLNDKIADPIAIIRMAYTVDAEGDQQLAVLDWDELRELIYASLEVNHHENLRELVDPNFRTPDQNGGTSSGAAEARVLDTLSRLSGVNSESSGSAGETPLTSPLEKSSESSQNETELSGMSDGGTSPSEATSPSSDTST